MVLDSMDKVEAFVNKAVAHAVEMMDGTKGEDWNGEHAVYEGICGWNGPMSPLNRAAFVEKIGETLTFTIEEKAKKVLAERAAFWENSKAKKYEEQASTFRHASASCLQVGNFVWGVTDGLKCDHENLRAVIRHLVDDVAEQDLNPDQLCRIVRIEETEDIERDAETILRNWRTKEREGGCASDDVDGNVSWNEMTREQKRTFYTPVVMIRDSKERYVLIDPEGYDYPRYVILPSIWEKMFAKTVGEMTQVRANEKEMERKEKEREKAEALAAYKTRCEKWAGIMQELPENLKGHSYHHDYRKIGKRNVLAMAKAAFPWVKFSVSYDGGWGTGYILRWKNGPTKDEVENAGDYSLFCPWVDTFDGMTDYADIERARFTDFADRFGGVGNGVKFIREEAETDRNGDPNGTPPKKPVKTEDASTGDVAVKENEAKGGLEIYFPAIPSETIRSYMKANGWRWSRFSHAWYKKDNEETRKVADEIVAMWKKERAVA